MLSRFVYIGKDKRYKKPSEKIYNKILFECCAETPSEVKALVEKQYGEAFQAEKMHKTLWQIADLVCPMMACITEQATVTAGNKDFLLCHSGLDNFDENKSPEDYTADELLWAWPEITDRYFDDIITVFGHTPTMSYDKNMKGKILITDTWIDVDVGVPYGNDPCLLRLDDLSSFTVCF